MFSRDKTIEIGPVLSYNAITLLTLATTKQLYNVILWDKHPRQSKPLVFTTYRLIMLSLVFYNMERIPTEINLCLFISITVKKL